VATSLAIPVRRIGRVDGSHWASLGHFAKKVIAILPNQPAIWPSLAPFGCADKKNTVG
jgi:hypothetical protein